MAKEAKQKNKAKKKKKKKQLTEKNLVSPSKATKLLVAAYGDDLNIDDEDMTVVFTKGQLDRMKRWSAGDPVLTKAVKILQGRQSMKKGPVNGVINALSLRPPRRR